MKPTAERTGPLSTCRQQGRTPATLYGGCDDGGDDGAWSRQKLARQPPERAGWRAEISSWPHRSIGVAAETYNLWSTIKDAHQGSKRVVRDQRSMIRNSSGHSLVSLQTGTIQADH